ncbi:unnamed protein product [Pieris macdunnoughi]|uniref:Uncharacterized protein n=1 Tax=Pieris macdunnoughi TaxID=345717 RepID=A0A821U365_9NEOP|nr:unnamed protein product [Pieris macdunnoughi]
MVYILDECPVMHSCCCCVPLRVATIASGVVGLIGAGGFLWVGSTEGARRLASSGVVGTSLLKLVRYFCGASGVLLAAAHALLIAAAVHESDALCEVYIWFMAVWSAVLFALTAAVSVQAALASFEASAFSALASALLLIVVIFLLIVIVANYRMTLP